ncbi:hypothetical protein L3Q82_000621 [Scortum barcoo]|uniref:Uncharacterized protein n=1 Tax=Scortum barcoo TaxID=214431 RepID=A0ACB8WFB0_9TELE|nr:hypothetical protein L3Q82_000621 [Scortum barcoo]
MLDLMWLECVSSSCKTKGIDAMDWPARSPDLNPIEHIWDIMSRSIHQRHVAPQTVQELVDALVQVWEEIPQETIHHHLIRSMPRLKLQVTSNMNQQDSRLVYCRFFAHQLVIGSSHSRQNSADITHLVLEAFPNYDHKTPEDEKFCHFVAGLDPALQSKMHKMGTEDLDEAVRIASRCERACAVLQLTSAGYPYTLPSEQPPA